MLKSWKVWAGVGCLAAVAAGAVAVAAWARGRAPASEGRLPGDFEPAGAVVLASRELVEGQQTRLLSELLLAAAGRATPTLLIDRPADQRALEDALAGEEIDIGRLRFLRAGHESSRIAEYGPFWIERPGRGPALLDAPRHPVEQRGRHDVAHDLAAHFDLPIIRLAVYLSGSNLISNGQGVAVTTTAILDQNADLRLDEQTIRDLLRQALGITKLIILPTLEGEPLGHAEWFVTFTAHDTVVVGRYDAEREPQNAAALDIAAAMLKEVEVEPGERLQVERIPMPPRDRSVWRSYTPVVFLPGVLLAPTYPGLDGGGQRAALDTYRRLLPDRRVIPIDVRSLVPAGVTLRSLVLRLGG